MVSTLPSSVVIECPHCGTRYQLPPEAIGPKGRKVACAHCGQTWQANAVAMTAPPNPDAIFDVAAERDLDDAFTAEERAVNPPPEKDPDEGRLQTIAAIRAAIGPRPRSSEAVIDATGHKSRQKAFNKRQAALTKQLPLARIRRVARVAGVSLLVALIVGGITFRTEIVRQNPDLAGAYEALGLGVNVIGLEFRDVTTLVTLRNGASVMQVDARIFSVGARETVVPPVLVTLLDDSGASVYEWSVVPDVRDLEPGEVVDFTTQLTSPPARATRVRLTFTDGKGRVDSPLSETTTTTSDADVPNPIG
jgi:predicted Zn finger-like uncharacterized protein